MSAAAALAGLHGAARAHASAPRACRPRPAVPKWLIMKIGLPCNNACGFCHIPGRAELSTDEVCARIARARAGGFTGVYFSGGEATIRPDIFALLAHATRSGLEAGLITNGRLAAYPDFARRLVRAGLREVHLSLHGSRPEVHDPIVGVAGGWSQAYDGLRRLLELGVAATVNMVVCRGNLDDLGATAAVLAELPITRLRLSMTDPAGRAFLQPEIVPEFEAAVRAAAACSRALPRHPRLAFDGWPTCFLDRADPHADLLDCDIYAMQEVWEDRWFPCDQGVMAHLDDCRGCALATKCPGVYTRYFRTPTPPRVRPRPGPVANSFDFTLGPALPVGRHAGIARDDAAAPPDCPLADATRAALHPIRDLVLDDDGALRTARTDTGDFSLLEIRRTVRTRRQVYRQAGATPFVADFARELRLLEPRAGCVRCTLFEFTCPGVWAAAPDDRFAPAEARLRARLSVLRGVVLDVGRGAGRFDDLFADLHARGLIRYRGFDPDRALIADAARRHPAWELSVATAETVALAPASLDAVLVLGAHNHLTDPWPAYRRLCAALRPGGRLLIADDVPFALVREPAAVARARAAEALSPPEHRRADDLPVVRDRLRALGFAVIEERPLTPGGVNQWLLELERPATPAPFAREGEPPGEPVGVAPPPPAAGGPWPVAGGRQEPDTEHRTPNTEHRPPDTGHRTPDTGHRTPDTGGSPLPPAADRRMCATFVTPGVGPAAPERS